MIARAPASSRSLRRPRHGARRNRSSVGQASSGSAADAGDVICRPISRASTSVRAPRSARTALGGAPAAAASSSSLHRLDGPDREPADARPVEVHVVRRQAELVEVRAERRRGDPLVPEVGDRRMAVTLRELLPVLAEQQAVVDHLGELCSESAGDAPLHRLVRTMVRPPDHMRDAEVEVVGNRGELVGRRPVGTQERHAVEPERAVRVAHGASLPLRRRSRLGVDLRALALAHRPFVPGDAEPVEVGHDRLDATRRRRASRRCRRSSTRACRRGRSRSDGSPRRSCAFPRCSEPVGLGANRTRTFMRRRGRGVGRGRTRAGRIPRRARHEGRVPALSEPRDRRGARRGSSRSRRRCLGRRPGSPTCSPAPAGPAARRGGSSVPGPITHGSRPGRSRTAVDGRLASSSSRSSRRTSTGSPSMAIWSAGRRGRRASPRSLCA